MLATAALAPAHAAGKLLVFSKTLGFRHDAGIAAGIAAIKSLRAKNGFAVDAAQKDAFRKFIRAGNGIVGLHNPTAYVLEGWGWYDSLVCARYESEIQAPRFRLKTIDKPHPSTAPLPDQWELADEDA